MSVHRDEVARIASLARLDLHPDEVERLTLDMNRILEHAAHLGEVAPVPGAGGRGGQSPQEVASSLEGGPVGGAGDASSPRDSDDGVEGGRVGGTGAPDSLAAPVEAWGPRVEEGFFVVPPLPGTRPGGSS